MAANVIRPDFVNTKCATLDQIHIFAELRSHVSVFNLTVDLGKSPKCESSVCTEQNTVLVESGNKSCKFQLQNVELLPSTCRGLQLRQTRELQMTLQVKDKHVNLQCEDHYGKSCRKQEAVCSNIQACQNHCYCAGCGQKLLKDHSIFSRVLPLPSENWFDLAEFWFCHRHGDEDGHIPSASPKPGDCLVGSLHILTFWSHVKQQSVSPVASDGLIKCSRCSNVLGVKLYETSNHQHKNGLTKPTIEGAASTCQLYLHAIHFRMEPVLSTASNICLQASVEVFLSELLQEQSRLYTCFRFLIQSQNSPQSQHPSSRSQHQTQTSTESQHQTQTSTRSQHQTIKILLWLIDQDLTLYQGRAYLSQSTDSVTVTSKKVVKTLYRCMVGQLDESSASGRCDSFLYRTWEKDNTVHGLTLPRPLCQQLISILTQNTSQMPRSQRHLNGFHVSYLLKDDGAAGKAS